MRRLLEWKYMNQQTNTTANSSTATASNDNSSAGNFPSQEERYKKLLAQIDKEKQFTYDLIKLTDNALVFILIDANNNNNSNITTIAIVYKPYVNPPVWKLGVNGNAPVDYTDWNDVLEILEVPGIIKDTSSLKEAGSSIAEEFETYNNLWSK